MNNSSRLFRHALVALAAIVFLSGCVVRPRLSSAHLTKAVDQMEIIKVDLPAGDAKTIKDREIYFSIVVVDCMGHGNRLPVEPYINGKLVSKFDFLVAGEYVTAQGTMPESVLMTFPTPCVALQGGSYFFEKLDSVPVPLTRSAR